jgi:hypothetical protein
VERVILKAVAKDPDDRYNRAGEMAEALRQAVAEAQQDHLVRAAAPGTLNSAAAPAWQSDTPARVRT